MIEIKSLVKIYKTGDEEVRAIDDISLNIEQGEIVAISGASGSGKTTLLNLIGTLDNITSGDIIINEHSIASMNEKEKTDYRKLNLGFIFQSYNLIPVLSALENVELSFQPLSKQELAEIGISDTKLAAKEALKAVGLEGYEERRPGQLSGGQQQRVSIARAIVRKPKILLADAADLNSLNRRTGLSPDSYKAIIKQGLRPGHHLRFSRNTFMKLNSSAVDNAHLYDQWKAATTPELK